MRSKPKKSLGQNFLVDKNIQEKIIRSCDLKEADTVLEIGPGRGELTQALLDRAKKVIAVEIDGELCAHLKEKFSSYANFVLINNDILKVGLSRLACGKGPGRLKVIANVPYYISTPIITHLLNHGKFIETIFITLQKELAARLAASAGSKSYGAFSCLVQFYAKPKILFSIKNSSFWPRPKVDSSFIELKILSAPPVQVRDESLFFKIIRSGFNQRRKLLKNNLGRELPEAKIRDCFRTAGIKQGARAEDLSLRDFARVSNFFARLP